MGLWRCFVYLAAIGILCFLLGRILPKRWFHADMFPYRCYPFERGGRIYEKLGIKRWQNRVLDMSRILPGLMPAKAMDGRSIGKLPLMIRETCVAEFIHKILAVLGLYCLRLWPGIGGILVTVLYILLGNLPFILIQRYNRPRLLKLMKKCGLSDCEIPVEQGGQYACADSKL